MPDHLGRQLATIPALAAAAASTSTIRLGTMVLANDFRHPVVLAKEAATLDVLSHGRFELGLGAGWMASEYEAVGLPFASPPQRVARLEESVQVIKGLFDEEVFSFAGDYFQLRGARLFPRAIQKPRPPLLIGGGTARLLMLAARAADIVSVHPAMRHGTPGLAQVGADGTSAAFAKKIDLITPLLEKRSKRVELNGLIYAVHLGKGERAAVQSAGELLSMNRRDVRESPLTLIAPSVDDAAAILRERRDRFGISYYVVKRADMEAFAPVAEILRGGC